MNEYVQLLAQDSPLIALAELLGYQVYLNNFEHSTDAPIARYKVVSPHLISDGDDLVELLAGTIDVERKRKA